MNKVKFLIILIIFIVGLCSCKNDSKVDIDYPRVEEFESDLNKGEDLTGKIVIITCDKLEPNSTYGYNIQTGEHLNFCSEEDPMVEEGDKITVKVTSVKKVLLFYIIYYERI